MSLSSLDLAQAGASAPAPLSPSLALALPPLELDDNRHDNRHRPPVEDGGPVLPLADRVDGRLIERRDQRSTRTLPTFPSAPIVVLG